ncbi:hypothetical protein LTR36_010522 [Oleoguttula mirabilis]|uniref:Uncharacterized protein n=1 Tax=Oleoguttula mirabilis TaxID=1507867 RepID=A0AAV9J4E0_9PEZI|nr:hypothetical protein LTR36_010522 [Oleoguttula mirabilis]
MWQQRSSVPNCGTRGTSSTTGSRRPRSVRRARSLGHVSTDERYSDRTYELPTPSSGVTAASSDGQDESEVSEDESEASEDESEVSEDESHISVSPLRCQAPRGSQLLDPIRSKRQWTIEAKLAHKTGEAGHEQRVRWAPKRVLVSSIYSDADGLECITVCGKSHIIADRGDSFRNSHGQVVCNVRFPESWVTDAEMDELQYLSANASQGDEDGYQDIGNLDQSDEDGFQDIDNMEQPGRPDEHVQSIHDVSSSPLVIVTPKKSRPLRAPSAGRAQTTRASGGASSTRTSSPTPIERNKGVVVRDVPSSPLLPVDRRTGTSKKRPLTSISQSRSVKRRAVGTSIARAGSASSGLTWSALDLGRIASLREHPTSDLADYGPAIHRGILDALRNGVIRTTIGAEPGVVARRLDDQAKRPVQFSRWIVAKSKHMFNFLNHHMLKHSWPIGLATMSVNNAVAARKTSKMTPSTASFGGVSLPMTLRKTHARTAPAVLFPGTPIYNDRSLSPNEEEEAPPSEGNHENNHGSASSSVPSSVGPRRIFSDSVASSGTSMTLPDSDDVGDFVHPAKKPRKDPSPRDHHPVMSGGLGSGYSSDMEDRTSCTRTRQRRSSTLNDQRPSPDRAAGSASTVATGVRHRPNTLRDSARADSSSGSNADQAEPMLPGRCKELSLEAPSIPSAAQQPPMTHGAVVYSHARFEPGTMTEAQYSYIHGNCDGDNKIALQNYWKWAKRIRPEHARADESEYYRHDGCYFLNKHVIPVVCGRFIQVELI